MSARFLTPVGATARATRHAQRSAAARAAEAAAVQARTGAWPQQMVCACGGTCPRCALPAGGQPLPATLAGSLQSRLGGDMSGVRVHTGGGAARAIAQVGARRAFASGDHIVVGDPQFSPLSAAGQQLLTHEAVHVLQQRGSGQPTARSASLPTTLEHEAGQAAMAFAHGGAMAPVRQGTAPAGVVQHDEPASAASPSTSTLQLDPEIQAQIYVAQWLAQQSTGADPAAAGDAAAAPLPALWLGPLRLGAETLDYGSLITPYYNRGLMPNSSSDTRDHDVISSLFNDRYRLVLNLPDLRAAVPGFVRPLIPSNWRVQLAATLTSTTIDWALSRDHPTFFELSNQTWQQFTGASTISLPMLPVPFVSGWWNRISGGDR